MRAMLPVSASHFKVTGGIGTGIQGMINTLNTLGYEVDILLDRPVINTDNSLEFAKNVNANIIELSSGHSYIKHKNVFAFRDTVNWDLVSNFRDVIFYALQHNTYDLCIVQTSDAIFATYGLELYRHMPLVFYTHDHNSVFPKETADAVFNSSYFPLLQVAQKLPGIITATHTELNAVAMSGAGIDANVLPLSISEPKLLEEYTGERIGALFIGRWEDRKNPKKFVKLIKDTGLPARIMTSKKSGEKFKIAFDQLGIKDYEIKTGIWGDEKVDFIKKCRVFYMPSKEESFGLAAYESLTQMPVVAHKKYDWVINFEDYDSFYAVDDENITETVMSAYYNHADSRTQILKNEKEILKFWESINYTPEQSFNKRATVLSHDDFYLKDYFKSLNRKIGIEDINTVLANRHNYTVTHTKTDTFFSKTGKIAEEKKSSFDELFN